jgi:hypothetical protein
VIVGRQKLYLVCSIYENESAVIFLQTGRRVFPRFYPFGHVLVDLSGYDKVAFAFRAIVMPSLKREEVDNDNQD